MHGRRKSFPLRVIRRLLPDPLATLSGLRRRTSGYRLLHAAPKNDYNEANHTAASRLGGWIGNDPAAILTIKPARLGKRMRRRYQLGIVRPDLAAWLLIGNVVALLIFAGLLLIGGAA